MGMQIDSSTDRHTAHCSVMQLQGCVICGELSGQLRETWALRVGPTGRTGQSDFSALAKTKRMKQPSGFRKVLVNYLDRLERV